jgi:hypothetical protein
MTDSNTPDSPAPDRNIKLGNIKLSDAGKYLGVGWRVVARLLKEGKIKTTRDPLDNRRKLVSTKDLDLLKQTSLKDE